MKWKIFISVLLFLSILSIYNAYSRAIPIITGNYQLYLNQNESIGIQLQEKYIEIELTTADSLNSSSALECYESKGLLRIESNVNGSIEINTNFNKVGYQINRNSIIPIADSESFSFGNGDTILISFSYGSAVINFYIGIVGAIMFCISPILSYKLTDNAKDKIKFMFVLIPMLLISFGLIMSFIYSGV